MEDSFHGIIDLVRMEQITWHDETLGATFDVGPVPDAMIETARTYRDKLIETVAEHDDDVMETYLADQPVSTDTLLSALRRLTIGLEVVPVLCGSALKNKGIQRLLDAIVQFLPNPLEVHATEGHDPKTGKIIRCACSDKEPLAALAFKVMMDQGRKLTYVRIYSGKLKTGASERICLYRRRISSSSSTISSLGIFVSESLRNGDEITSATMHHSFRPPLPDLKSQKHQNSLL
jgi:elongation factor G